MPVLVGPQGVGKSHLLRAILPPEHPEWFSDALHLAAHPKERVESLLGRVLVEVSEMAGAHRAEIQSLKAFLTRQDDGATRLAYRRNPEPMPRRAILAGTTNDAECLPNDPTGLRRFVPVEVPRGCDVQAYLDPQRHQLWAEAVTWYRLRGEDEDGQLPRHLLPKQAADMEGPSVKLGVSLW